MKVWESVRRFVSENARLVVTTLLLVLVLRTTAFASYHIPSESMVPSLDIGDRVVATKFDYGFSQYSLPFSIDISLPFENGRLFGATPKRGDVVIFRHTQSSITMIKRVIGLPGDHIQLKDGRLLINGAMVDRTSIRDYQYRDSRGIVTHVQEYIETLPNGVAHPIIERSDEAYWDQTVEYIVPEGHLFMMGDNRDNSSDSRVLDRLGYVPVENVIGKAKLMTFSLRSCDADAGVDCPAKSRFFRAL